MKIVLIAAAILAVAAGERARFDNYQVYRVTPTTFDQVKLLRTLEDTTTDFSFWKSTGRVNDGANIMVPPHKMPLFEDFLESYGLEATLQIPNVQKLIDDEAKQLATRSTKAIDWNNYYNLEELYGWLDDLEAANSNVKVVNAGKTYEGRDIKGIEITNGENLPGIILESGIHAREWIGPAATSWIVNEILNSDEDSIWRQYNYLYFPVCNPDGYAFTWNKDRSWRKTRQPYKVGLLTCYGADPNRNWDFHWMEGGSSSNACSETFAGSKAFSEIEVKNLASYFTSVSSRYDIYVGFHSFSQLLMYPWGYTGTDTPMEATWKRIGNAAAADLKAVHGTSFEVGSIYDTIYQASGSSIEWYYGEFNSTLTYVFELRDQGQHGFVLPANQIIPSAEELIKAVERFAVEYQKLPPKNKSSK